jgi:hypothetical protein
MQLKIGRFYENVSLRIVNMFGCVTEQLHLENTSTSNGYMAAFLDTCKKRCSRIAGLSMRKVQLDVVE